MAPFWESGNVGWKLWFPDSVDVYGKRKNIATAEVQFSEWKPGAKGVEFAAGGGIGLVVKDSYGARHLSVAQQQGNELFRFPERADGKYEYMIAAGWSEGEMLKTAAEFRDYVVGVARGYNSPARLAGFEAQVRE